MLCVAYASVSYPCGYYETVGDEYTYMFKIYDYDEYFLWNRNNIFRSNNIKFWYKYTHGNVDSTVIEKALYECSADDIDNGTNVFFVYLHKINDAEALRYWSVIKTFSAKMNDPWYYPNRAEKREISRLIEEIDGILNSRTSEQLKERYMYVLMQMLFYMKQYGTCRDIWETRKFVWNDKELELRCLLYYAGALFYSGRETEAADIYADNGEWQNFRYFDKSVAFMNKLYAASPNSKAFMFFVQNYLNQQQDKRAFNSCDDFIALCEKAVSEKKSDDPALWQSALAHIAFLRGDVVLPEPLGMAMCALHCLGDLRQAGGGGAARRLSGLAFGGFGAWLEKVAGLPSRGGHHGLRRHHADDGADEPGETGVGAAGANP